jgi:hypothetical protein
VCFDVTDQLLIISTFVILVLIDLKKAHDSLRREVLYNILIEFGLPMKLGRLKCV